MQGGLQLVPARTLVARYTVAVLAVAVALALKFLLTPPTLVESPFVLFFAAVTVSAWYGGLGPGLVATVLAAGGSVLFFLPPLGAMSIESQVDGLRLVLFLFEGGVVSALSGALHRARRHAEEALQVRDRFLHVAAHELKNPLAVLLGYTQFLQRRAAREGSAEATQQEIQALGSQTVRLHRLVDSLLDLSRIERGSFSLDPKPLDIAALVQQLVQEIRPTLDRHTLTLSTPPAPVMVIGDTLRLSQVLQNLLQNAVKYSPAGGEIALRVVATASHASVAVRDHGIGIPERALPRLFERYYRAERPVPGGAQGLGIGLTVAREIVEQHGGSIAVSSVEGGGSTFTISLPLDDTAVAQRENSRLTSDIHLGQDVGR